MNCSTFSVRSFIWLLILSISAFAHAADSTSLKGRKIDFLIASIETLQGAQFIRNGTAYSAKDAADHFLKLRSAGSRVSTAEDFIHHQTNHPTIPASSMIMPPLFITRASGGVFGSFLCFASW